LNPGPHGPESDDLPSSFGDSCRFQLEISDPDSQFVQVRANRHPDYYTKYYRIGSARRVLAGLNASDQGATPNRGTQSAQAPILAVKDEDLTTAWFNPKHPHVGTTDHEVLVYR
jgi:hypothetical protein